MKNLKRSLICLISLLVLISCSTHSKNMISDGVFTLSQIDSKSYVFKRYSWYQELTLNFDLLISKIERTDALYRDFSISEQGLLKDCKSVYIAFTYEMSSRRVPLSDLIFELSNNQTSSISTPHFKKSIKMHPGFIEESLQLYKFHTFCSMKPNLNLHLHFPGFKAQEIKL